ncbi:MAG: SWIM zinc finger domain-containing protein [Haliscomenobacter sp.]
MYLIFKVPRDYSFSRAIEGLKDDRIIELFSRPVLHRAHRNAERFDLIDIQKGRVEAEIAGTPRYEQELEFRDSQVFGRCSCPFGDHCKHIAALLIRLRQMGAEALRPLDESPTSPFGGGAFDFEAYLETLSAPELRKLLLEFTPKEYRRNLARQFRGDKQGGALLEQVSEQLKQIFIQAEASGSARFEDQLIEELEKLRPIWSVQSIAVLQVLKDAVRQIDALIEAGYLRDPSTGLYFEGEKLGLYLSAFAAAQDELNVLPTLEGLTDILKNLERPFALSCFVALLRDTSGLKIEVLKPYLLSARFAALPASHIQKLAWKRLEPLLGPSHRIQFLTLRQSDAFFIKELAVSYLDEYRPEKAIQTLEAALSSGKRIAGNSADLFRMRIELEREYREDREIDVWLSRFVRETPTKESLQYALGLQPSQRAELEQVLQQANVLDFLAYLDAEGRYDEVLPSLARIDDQQPEAKEWKYQFLLRHKKRFPEAAKAVCIDVLDENLPLANERAYMAAADALRHLKDMEPAQRFSMRMHAICNEYRRRARFMEILEREQLLELVQ